MGQFMKEEIARMKIEIKQLKNKPYAVECAWQNSWKYANRVITYDRLTTNEMSGGYGGLNQHWRIHCGPRLLRYLGCNLQHEVPARQRRRESGLPLHQRKTNRGVASLCIL